MGVARRIMAAVGVAQAIELVGLALVVAAAWLVHPALGLLVLGAGLIAVANYGDWTDDDADPE